MSQARRRQFLIASGALLAAPLARAQQTGKVRRVGILVTNLRGGSQYIEAMKAGLRERGWIEGKNLVIDLRDADGNSDLFPKLAAELVAAKPDVIFASTYLAVLAVTDETNAIPVVFAAISDPVKAGHRQEARLCQRQSGLLCFSLPVRHRAALSLRTQFDGDWPFSEQIV